MQISETENQKPTMSFERMLLFSLPILVGISSLPILLPGEVSYIFSSFLMPLIILVPFVLSILSARESKNIEFKEKTFSISLFLGFFFIAEMLWLSYIILSLNITDKTIKLRQFVALIYYPMWVLAYFPLYYVGVSTVIRYYEYLKLKDTMKIMLFGFIFVIVLILTLGISIVNSNVSGIEKTVLILYLLLNTGVLILMAALLALYKSGFMSEYWLFLTMGIIMFSIGDMIFAYGKSANVNLQSFNDAFYIFSYLILALGFAWVYMNKSKLVKMMPEGEFQIKEIFLINFSGIILSQANVKGTTIKADRDLIASMLIAIQDFVKTSFNTKETMLKEIYYGNFSINIEQGKYVSIAVVVLGKLTQEIRHKIIQTIETIEVVFSKDLQDFDGDVSKFANAEKYLQELVA